MQGPRERMVVSAALLIRERGAHATAISDVLQHSGAPRGSAYHYFPGGRTQLLCEAVDYAGEHVAAMINEAEGGLELLDALIDKYRQQLLSTDFRAGCPIAAVSVEAGDEQDRERMAPVIARAAAVFDRWSDLTAQRFIADGIPPDRAPRLDRLRRVLHGRRMVVEGAHAGVDRAGRVGGRAGTALAALAAADHADLST